MQFYKCNKSGLVWTKVGTAWRLRGGMNVDRETGIHNCQEYPCNVPNMQVKSPTMTQRNVLRRFDLERYDEYLSRLNQDETERLTTMLLGG